MADHVVSHGAVTTATKERERRRPWQQQAWGYARCLRTTDIVVDYGCSSRLYFAIINHLEPLATTLTIFEHWSWSATMLDQQDLAI